MSPVMLFSLAEQGRKFRDTISAFTAKSGAAPVNVIIVIAELM